MCLYILKLTPVYSTSQLRKAIGDDAEEKKPVDSQRDALKSRKQIEESRQVSTVCSVNQWDASFES